MANSKKSNNESDHSQKNKNTGIGKGFIIVNVDYDKQGEDMFNIAEINYSVVDGIKLFQGDIIVQPYETLKELEKAKDIIRKEANQKFVAQTYGLWPNGVVYYRLHLNIRAYRSIIQQTCAIWSEGTDGKITFKEIDRPQKNYVLIQAANENSSDLGMKNTQQNMFLQNPPEIGTILHELGHTIGLWHEHQRADRDEYVKIYLENIYDDVKGQFMQVQDMRITSMGLPYDYSSIMHYNRFAFSKNNLPTIEPTKDPSAIIGQRQYPSELDFLGIKKLY
jgi:astacin